MGLEGDVGVVDCAAEVFSYGLGEWLEGLVVVVVIDVV